MGEIIKTRSISDAQIQFVSLVDKAANKKSFLITKSEDGKASFSAYGKIVKKMCIRDRQRNSRKQYG